MTIRDGDSEKESQLRSLKWSLQALAAPPSQQLALFPDYVSDVDALAVDFDNWAAVIRSRYASELSQNQVASLADIDRKLSLISRIGADYDPDIWTDAALVDDDHWADIRTLATIALEAFGWSVESPSADPAPMSKEGSG